MLNKFCICSLNNSTISILRRLDDVKNPLIYEIITIYTFFRRFAFTLRDDLCQTGALRGRQDLAPLFVRS